LKKCNRVCCKGKAYINKPYDKSVLPANPFINLTSEKAKYNIRYGRLKKQRKRPIGDLIDINKKVIASKASFALRTIFSA